MNIHTYTYPQIHSMWGMMVVSYLPYFHSTVSSHVRDTSMKSKVSYTYTIESDGVGVRYIGTNFYYRNATTIVRFNDICELEQSSGDTKTLFGNAGRGCEVHAMHILDRIYVEEREFARDKNIFPIIIILIWFLGIALFNLNNFKHC